MARKRVARGWLYLTAVLDWYSRYVLAWRLSDRLDGTFCCEALDEALSMRRARAGTTSRLPRLLAAT